MPVPPVAGWVAESEALLILVVGPLLLGVGLELVQALIPGRSASAYDDLANAIGRRFGFGQLAPTRCKASGSRLPLETAVRPHILGPCAPPRNT